MRPAIAVLELSAIPTGIAVSDAMVKRAPVAVLYAGTIHPGRFLALVGGDTASVEEALSAGLERAAATVLDQLLLTDVHPAVVDALAGARVKVEGEAVGVVETHTVSATIVAADAGVKAAQVGVLELRLGDELGGKGYVTFGGVLAEVEAAVDAAVASVPADRVADDTVVPMLAAEVRENLLADGRFGRRVITYGAPEA